MIEFLTAIALWCSLFGGAGTDGGLATTSSIIDRMYARKGTCQQEILTCVLMHYHNGDKARMECFKVPKP